MRTIADVERFLQEHAVRFQDLGDGLFIVTEDNTSGSNTNNSGSDEDANAGTPAEDSGNTGGKADSGATGGMQKDAGQPAKCPAASCAMAMDAGSVLSDVAGAPITVQGMGNAFVKVSAQDGQSFANSAGGIRAKLTSAGGNYDLFAYGSAADACADLSISSTNPAGQADEVAPIWAVNGPVVTVDWVVTFEVRAAVADQCAESWTLNLEGNPCMVTGVVVPQQCP